jgi:hypothetical protein
LIQGPRAFITVSVAGLAGFGGGVLPIALERAFRETFFLKKQE